MNLADKKCIPCEGGMKPLSEEAAQTLAKEVPEWKLSGDNKSISREYIFNDFKEAMGFVNEVADSAEFEGHHPDIAISWNKVLLTFSTHSIGGLSENDFIVAAKINLISINSQ